MTEPQSEPDAERPADPDIGDVRFGQEDTLEVWTGTAWTRYQHPARDSDDVVIYKYKHSKEF